MGVVKTAVGLAAGIGAVGVFKASKGTHDPVEKVVALAAGSLLAATSYHLLKDKISDAADGIKKLVR